MPKQKKERVSIQLPTKRKITAQRLILSDIPDKSTKNVYKLLNFKNYQHAKEKQFRLISELLYISPIGNTSLIYNLFYLFFFYTLQFHISLSMTFGMHFMSDDISDSIYRAYYWVLVGFFGIDIFVSFNKGYYSPRKAVIVQDYVKIFWKYASWQLWLDLLCMIFLIIPNISESQKVQFTQLVPVILMWVKKSKNQHQIIHRIQYHKVLRNAFILSILGLDLLMIGHYGACIFIKIDFLLQQNNYYGTQLQYYWYTVNDPYGFLNYDGHWYLYYVYAQGFATGTLSTISPGPFPTNPFSVVYAILTIIFFIILTSYVAEILIEIVETQKQSRIDYEQKIQLFDRFMRWKKVPLKIKTQVHNHFQIVWQVDKKNRDKQYKKLLLLLPSSLKRQLILQMSFFQKLQIFQFFNEKDILLYEISTKIKRKIINADANIFYNNQIFYSCNEILFLVSGVLKYYISIGNSKETQQYVLSLSNTTRFIGLYQFISGQACQTLGKTLDICQVDTIKRNQFYEAIKLTKNQEQWFNFKNQVLIERKMHLINKVCLFCQDSSHSEQLCPQIFIEKKIYFNLIKGENNIFTRSQLRTQNFDRDFINNKKLFKSIKIYNKNRPLINSLQRFEVEMDMSKSYLSNSNYQDQRNKKNRQKAEEFEVCKFLQYFHPKFNPPKKR